MKGLYIGGIEATGISQLMEKYVAEYFNGYKLDEGESMFQEGHVFYFEEIKDVIPAKYHHFIKNEDKFGGLSGYITIGCKDGNADERIISVLMCECGSYLYLLSTQEIGENGIERTIIIKDFIE